MIRVKCVAVNLNCLRSLQEEQRGGFGHHAAAAGRLQEAGRAPADPGEAEAGSSRG